jgi:hypothetical protein
LTAAALVLAAGTSAQTGTQDELNTAIRGASDYLNSKIPKGSKIVVLNVQSNSPELSDYIIDELIANAVNDKVFTVVNRKQLDDIRKEQMFQMSGEVDDKDALAIGKIFGAQTIVSGVVSALGAVYSLRINALEVQTAQVQGQFNRNITSSQIISSLMGSGGGYSAPRTITPTASAAPATGGVSKPLVTGTAVPGSNITEKLVWLQRGADSHNTYIIEVNADENITSHTLEYPNIINITIAIRGIGANRNVRLGSNGTMFTVKPNVTFILENNITLHGHSQNNSSLVYVDGGIFIMNAGTSITGNNGASGRGGGVYVGRGTFTMNSGTISGNTANSGGGVYVSNGTFTMNGGTIFDNTAADGGGVFISGGNFTKTNGVIQGNTASSSGGGVYAGGGTFTMRGGNIAKNTAVSGGGGVCIRNGSFSKTGGTITGYKSDANNGNMVMDGTVLPRSGHTVFVSPTVRKETTAGPTVNLSYSNGRPSGAWDQ